MNAREALIDAIGLAGWKSIPTQGPGIYTFRAPAGNVEVPTPGYVTKSMWPGGTYTRERHVTLIADQDGKIVSVLVSEHVAPWVRGTGARKVSFKAALAFIANGREDESS